MIPKYEYGQALRVIRTIRDDGTFPGKSRGEHLIRKGSIGHVLDVGTFLQDQLIYRMHFIDEGMQVGCREEELIPAEAPWIESKFEFRQMVLAAVDLASQGKILVAKGDQGQILKVLRESENNVSYQVRFPGRTLQVREQALVEATL